MLRSRVSFLRSFVTATSLSGAVIFVSVFLFALHIYYSAHKEIREALLHTAETLAGSLEEVFSETTFVLESLHPLVARDVRDVSRVAALLRDAHMRSSSDVATSWAYISWRNSQNRVVADSIHGVVNVPFEGTDTDSFSLPESPAFFGKPYYGASYPKWVLPVRVSVLSEAGDALGVLEVGLDIQQLYRFLRRTVSQKGLDFLLFDSTQQALLSSSSSLLEVKEGSAVYSRGEVHQYLYAFLKGSQNLFLDTVFFSNQPSLYLSKLTHAPFVLYLTLDAARAGYAIWDVLAMRMLEILALMLAIALLLSTIYLGHQHVIQPLRYLEVLGARIQAEKPLSRLPRRGAHDIIRLSYTLLQLRRLIWRKSRALHRAQSSLEHFEYSDRAYEQFLRAMRNATRKPFSEVIEALSTITLKHINPAQPSLSPEAELALLSKATRTILTVRSLSAETLEESMFNVSEALEECTTILTKHFLRQNILLECHFVRDMPPLWGDSLRFKQIVLSGLSRAMECLSYQGKVHLSADVELRVGGRELVVTIRDNGFGLSEESRKQTYSFIDLPPRYNLDGTHCSTTVVEKLVQMHEGSMKIEDIQGTGSVVTFRFPYRDSPRAKTLDDAITSNDNVLVFPGRK